MSLAQVVVDPADFDLIHEHLTSRPKYRNMHMRAPCQRQGERALRYLHAMYAPAGKGDLIEGAISGPGIHWRYSLVKVRGRTQLNVLRDEAPPKERARIERRFVREILSRVTQERGQTTKVRPKRTAGQFYLRRWSPGSDATHPNCMSAVGDGVLAPGFVSLLSGWNFQLLHP